MALRLKSQVAIAFSLRLMLVPAGISRLHIIYAVHHSENPDQYTVRLAVMSIITLHTVVIAATVPCLKPFLAVFTSGMLSRPRHSALPTHRKRRHQPHPHTWSRDRSISAEALRLRPMQGQSSATVEFVPPERIREQRPSLAHTLQSHSSGSIRVLRDFSVSFQNVGSVLNTPQSSMTATPHSSRTQGSSPGFPWHWGRRLSDQATPEARVRGSIAGVSNGSRQSEARSSAGREECVEEETPRGDREAYVEEETPRGPSP